MSSEPEDGCRAVSGQSCVGVAIVHYYRFRDLLELMKQLRSNPLVDERNVVVCDNGSNPGEIEQLKSLYPRVNVKSLANIGYGAAANVGVRAVPTNCNHVLVATHELRMKPECIRLLSSALDSDQQLGMVGPLLKRSDDMNVIWSSGGRMSTIRKMPLHRTNLVNDSADCDWLDGSAIMFRRVAFEEADGFAESFFLYFEDVELGLVVKSNGWQVRCVLEAEAYQTPGGHLNHRLAVRNLAWTLRSQGLTVAYSLWIAENLVRVVIGTVGKPSGALDRQRQRAGAVLEAIRLPEELKSRGHAKAMEEVKL